MDYYTSHEIVFSTKQIISHNAYGMEESIEGDQENTVKVVENT